MKTEVLVTGANGFLGSALVKKLCEDGVAVRAFVRPTSDLSLIKNLPVQFFYGDIRDQKSLLAASYNVDTVFHLAAVMTSLPKQKHLLHQVNVTGTQNVSESCIANGVRRLVHVSSVAAIGTTETGKEVLNEDSKCNAKSARFSNFISKQRSEELILNYCQTQSLNAVVVNPSLIYGAGDIRKEIRRGNILAAKGKLPFYCLGGVNIIALEDAVDGIISAWRRGKSGERYILSGENLTMKDFFGLISEFSNAPAPRHKLPTFIIRLIGRMVDLLKLNIPLDTESTYSATSYHWYENTKARRDLDFRPRPARQAIFNSVKWMQDNGYLS